MLKAAGWVIGDEAARIWLKKHPNISIPEGLPFFTPYLTLRSFLQRRELANEQLPIKSQHLDTLQYPKTTPEKFGEAKCVLIRRLYRASKETWKDYEELSVRPEDEELRSWLEKDGLKVGEWITIPDPWDADWPFSKRHPGKGCPKHPYVLKEEERLRAEGLLPPAPSNSNSIP